MFKMIFKIANVESAFKVGGHLEKQETVISEKK